MVEIVFEEIDEITLDTEKVEKWYALVCEKESKELGDISLIFCSDEYLLDVNRKYLDHDYYTDIITFDYTEGDVVSGDLFISVDRVKDNASELNLSFEEELKRVMVHGVLHLCGYMDKTEEDELVMRKKEDESMLLFE